MFVHVFVDSNPSNLKYYIADYMCVTCSPRISPATIVLVACGSRCLPIAAVPENLIAERRSRERDLETPLNEAAARDMHVLSWLHATPLHYLVPSRNQRRSSGSAASKIIAVYLFPLHCN
jgi:hypothetical protein